MTVLLTGVTGFIGQWVAEYLLQNSGIKLRVITRPQSIYKIPHADRLEIFQADLRNPESLYRAMDGIETVYHTAGLISFQRANATLVQEVNYQGAVNLFNAALEAGVKKVVYTASIFAIGLANAPDKLHTEDHDFNADHLLDIPYLKAKRDAELAAITAIEQGLPLVRLYPGLCLGPGDWNRSSTKMVDSWLHGKLPAIIGGGGISFMDVRDAALAHIAAMQHGIPGARYLATGYNTTLLKLFDLLAEITGRRVPLVLPPWPGIAIIRLIERMGIPLPVEGAQARLMRHHWWYDCERSLRDLHLQFRPLEETIAETVQWLQSNPSST
jgi:dihydroflavonol-4-reductase